MAPQRYMVAFSSYTLATACLLPIQCHYTRAKGNFWNRSTTSISQKEQGVLSYVVDFLRHPLERPLLQAIWFPPSPQGLSATSQREVSPTTSLIWMFLLFWRFLLVGKSLKYCKFHHLLVQAWCWYINKSKRNLQKWLVPDWGDKIQDKSGTYSRARESEGVPRNYGGRSKNTGANMKGLPWVKSVTISASKQTEQWWIITYWTK